MRSTLFILCSSLLILGQACSSNSSAPSSTTATNLSLGSGSITVSPGTSTNLTPTSGTAPFTYALLSGTGTVSGSLFYASSTIGTSYVSITDATGVSVIETIVVSSTGTSGSGTMTAIPLTVAVSSQVTISVSGGTAPYTYAVVSGSGSISSNIFVAPATAGTSEVSVTDSTGASVIDIITIGGTSGTTTALYRDVAGQYNSHMSSIVSNEGSPIFTQETTLMYVYTSQDSTSYVPIYRCHNGVSHMTTLSSVCEGAPGWVYDFQLGYLDSVAGSGEVPLYRLHNSATGDHLDSTISSEGVGSGYVLDTILGYGATF